MISVQDVRSEQVPRQSEGRNRVVIEHVRPEVDCGRFPIKRVAGESVVVEADVFADSHDQVSCQVAFRQDREDTWTQVSMEPLGNDRWRGEFQVSSVGSYRYTVEGWVDGRFVTRYEKDLTVLVDRNKA